MRERKRERKEDNLFSYILLGHRINLMFSRTNIKNLFIFVVVVVVVVVAANIIYAKINSPCRVDTYT